MRQELERLLDTHRAQRPEMQPQDYYKLCLLYTSDAADEL